MAALKVPVLPVLPVSGNANQPVLPAPPLGGGRNGKREREALLTLVNAINRCCDVRGDDDANRVALVAECNALDAAGEADRWERACRGGRPCVDDAARCRIGPAQHKTQNIRRQ